MDLELLYQIFLQSEGVSTDTRNIKSDCMFFALKGQRFNGNAYANQALEAGAAWVVIDEAQYYRDERFILVEDVLSTLQQLATFHREQLGTPLIAVTGSNGKTTTKELLSAVLSKRYNTLATIGNLNNHIGVPLTLLRLTSQTEVGVIEMGANHIGDIAELCRIAEPDFGLITNIGYAHLEGFGSIEGVLQGKTELYQHLAARQGKILVNRNNPKLVGQVAEMSAERLIFYGGKQDQAFASLVDASPWVSYADLEGNIHQTQLAGAYNFDNILTAIAVGKLFDVADAAIHAAIAGYSPSNNRSQIVRTKQYTLIMDAYNANPSSMEVAIRNFAQMQAPSKVAILGDMLELGDYAPQKHREVIEQVAGASLEKALFCGSEFMKAASGLTLPEGFHFFEYREQISSFLMQHPLNEGALVLLKGSRGIGLEALLPSLQGEF